VFFAWDIPIPADTKADTPYIKTLKLTIGVITRIAIKFPRGCHGMVKVRLDRFKFQFLPLSAGEWVTGDEEAVGSEEFFEIREPPAELVFYGCSPGTTYDHVVTVRITVLPKKVASMIPVIELLSRLLQRMGVIT